MPNNVQQFTYTAAADTKFRLVQSTVWCREVNIHILTNDARYGDMNISAANPSIAAGNGISFQDVNLADLFFQNTNAGSNTTIFAVAVIMTTGRKRDLGVL